MSTLRVTVVIAGLLAGASIARGADPAPAESLDQLVQQLQKTPDDGALRDRIIQLARSNEPAPAVPEEARRFLARGTAAVESAGSPAELTLALAEFSNASNVAPWWAVPYFNLALVQEKLEDFQGAAASYKRYLAIAPDAKDAEKVRTKLYKLEFLAEKKAKPKVISMVFTGDADGEGVAHGDGDDFRFDLKGTLQPNASQLLTARFQGATVAEAAQDAALTITVDESGTSWTHSCGLFSCDVTIRSKLTLSASSPGGLRVDQPVSIDIQRSVSKGNSGFRHELFARDVPGWISAEVMPKLQALVDRQTVRDALGKPAAAPN